MDKLNDICDCAMKCRYCDAHGSDEECAGATKEQLMRWALQSKTIPCELASLVELVSKFDEGPALLLRAKNVKATVANCPAERARRNTR